MSKKAFVSYAGRGFWAYDVALGVFLKYLLDAAQENRDANLPWLSEAIASWRVWAEIVSWPFVDDLRIFPRGEKEVLTAPVVELGRAMVALLRNELPDALKGEAWFFGTPTGRITI